MFSILSHPPCLKAKILLHMGFLPQWNGPGCLLRAYLNISIFQVSGYYIRYAKIGPIYGCPFVSDLSLPLSSRPGKPSCLNASYTMIATELDRFSDLASALMGIRMQRS